MWKCKQCGACCKIITIGFINMNKEQRRHLEARGISIDEESKRLIIPARCKYLTEDNLCSIHENKFSICAGGGKEQCKEAKRRYAICQA